MKYKTGHYPLTRDCFNVELGLSLLLFPVPPSQKRYLSKENCETKEGQKLVDQVNKDLDKWFHRMGDSKPWIMKYEKPRHRK